MRRPSNKAQISIQFNWVFAIIIGAVILSFFVVVIQKQKRSSDLELANELLSDMDLILAGQSVSVGREDLMEIPERQIIFDCEEYSIMDMTRQKGNSLIFSPKSFESDRMLAWTLSWNLPFKIANFIYLTTPDIKYYLVTDDDTSNPMTAAGYIMNNFPENLELREVASGDFGTIPEDDNQIRLIFLDASVSMPEDLIGTSSKDVTALKIETDGTGAEGLASSELTFYIKDGGKFAKHGTSKGGMSEGSYPAFGKEAVFGAIFTNDINLYHCTMIKALKRMAVVADVYNKRANTLKIHASSSCKDYYLQIFDDFIYDKDIGILDSASLNELKTFQNTVFSGIDYAAKANRNTILASCSTLY